MSQLPHDSNSDNSCVPGWNGEKPHWGCNGKRELLSPWDLEVTTQWFGILGLEDISFM